MKVNLQKGTVAMETIFSECGEHRYILKKSFTSDKKELNKGKLIFFLLNPSFADELLMDKANRIASNIAIKRNFKELVILNLFSVITENSKYPLERQSKSKYEENDYYIKKELKSGDEIIIGWGTDKKYIRRKEQVRKIIKNNFKDLNNVLSIKYEENNPAHISYYISDNTENYEIVPYQIK
ncbi:DUF1643 domain-containing protein [Clostridium sp. FP2]|uniref:DUF1643 domain-containing protein n=1 Tax=Clostridium sp. FP2 TaxID=2724481 RepID=UPI0013E91E32|nr:DUF1643 domain-containing protein [Clostridium sp. FP2]MBZ9621401.1 DUF1643 domain-containing protein [Clostridium sp. FP2]